MSGSFWFPTGDRQVNERSNYNRDCRIHGRRASVSRDTCFASPLSARDRSFNSRIGRAHINDARNLRSGSLVGSPLVPGGCSGSRTDSGFVAALVCRLNSGTPSSARDQCAGKVSHAVNQAAGWNLSFRRSEPVNTPKMPQGRKMNACRNAVPAHWYQRTIGSHGGSPSCIDHR
jgi:hypothetical protein